VSDFAEEEDVSDDDEVKADGGNNTFDPLLGSAVCVSHIIE
jgi:hypothetical protein